MRDNILFLGLLNNPLRKQINCNESIFNHYSIQWLVSPFLDPEKCNEYYGKKLDRYSKSLKLIIVDYSVDIKFLKTKIDSLTIPIIQYVNKEANDQIPDTNYLLSDFIIFEDRLRFLSVAKKIPPIKEKSIILPIGINFKDLAPFPQPHAHILLDHTHHSFESIVHILQRLPKFLSYKVSILLKDDKELSLITEIYQKILGDHLEFIGLIKERNKLVKLLNFVNILLISDNTCDAEFLTKVLFCNIFIVGPAQFKNPTPLKLNSPTYHTESEAAAILQNLIINYPHYKITPNRAHLFSIDHYQKKWVHIFKTMLNFEFRPLMKTE